MPRFKDILDKKGLIIFLRILIGGFFILTGLIKLRLPVEEVQALIRTFQVLPADFTYSAAFVLPWIELIPGLLLVIGIRPLYSMGFIMGLTAIFVLGLISIIARGIPVEDCGCLGGWIKETPPVALLRDMVIIILSLPVLKFYLRERHS